MLEGYCYVNTTLYMLLADKLFGTGVNQVLFKERNLFNLY